MDDYTDDSVDNPVQRLIAENPGQATRAFKALHEEVKQRRENGNHRTEDGTMPEGESNTDTKFFRSISESIKESGRSEGVSATKLKIWILTSVIGILWIIGMALASVIWKDSAGKIEKLENQVQQMQLNNAASEARELDRDRRMREVETDLKTVLNELRKPK